MSEISRNPHDGRSRGGDAGGGSGTGRSRGGDAGGGSGTGRSRGGTLRADLKIADWEYLHAEKILDVYLETMMTAAKTFSHLMGNVQQKGIDDGADGPIVSACAVYADKMGFLAGQLDAVRRHLEGKSDTFIQEVDDADNFIY